MTIMTIIKYWAYFEIDNFLHRVTNSLNHHLQLHLF